MLILQTGARKRTGLLPLFLVISDEIQSGTRFIGNKFFIFVGRMSLPESARRVDAAGLFQTNTTKQEIWYE